MAQQQIKITEQVTGVLPIANGGTGATTLVGASIPTLTSADTLTNKTLTAPIISTIVNTGTLTLPTATDTIVARTTTDTLTNKRVSKRVVVTTQSATPAINTDNGDIFQITGLAQAVTSFTTSLTGTPVA